jgi:hypothetical protein
MTTSRSTQALSFEERVKEHGQRWRRIIRERAGKTNREMSEQGLNDLYELILKKKPKAIVWCESPLQMAVIPPMVTNILESIEWAQLRARINSEISPFTPQSMDSLELQSVWQSHWSQLESSRVRERLSRMLAKNQFRRAHDEQREAAHKKLANVMFDIFKNTDLGQGSMIKSDMFTSLLNGKSTENNRTEWQNGTSLEPHINARKNSLPARIAVTAQVSEETGRPAVVPNSNNQVIDTLIHAMNTLTLARTIGFKPKHHTPQNLAKAEQARQLLEGIGAQALRTTNWLQLIFPIEFVMPDSSVFEKPSVQQTGSILKEIGRVVKENQKAMRADQDAFVAAFVVTWLPGAVPWLPFALACRFIDPEFFGELDAEIDCWALLTHGAAGYLFGKSVAFACEKPTKCILNEDNVPHCIDGPAVVWADGLKTYAWKNLVVDEDIIEKRHLIDVNRINNETNAELRRAFIDLYSESRYLIDAKAKIIDTSRYGTLYRLPLVSDEDLVMVRVFNSTPERDGTYKTYFLRVPPTTRTAREAVAWTFGLEEFEYDPFRET